MKLKGLILENFRSYRNRIYIDIEEDLTAFVGQNDVGKSTILEALEIFFNNKTVKIDSADINIHSENSEVTIGCIFYDLPTIDDNESFFVDHYLLNEDGFLEIHKVFGLGGSRSSEKVYIHANHPSVDGANDLLSLSISELRRRLDDLGIDTEVNRRDTQAIRKCIWDHFSDNLELQPRRILVRDDIWEKIKSELPIYALFQADRSSNDGDNEVQDPMKVAIKQAILNAQSEIREIQEKVKLYAQKVAERTVQKLSEMDRRLANNLKVEFKSEPKWDTLFKLSLVDEDKIPINKRGSGVRRLILLNFFRAEAERRNEEEGPQRGIIYAIEEPETSQHPNNQEKIITALKELSKADKCQVLLTTHVPALAGLLPTNSLRLVDINEQGEKVIKSKNETVYREIADRLGILPNYLDTQNLKVIVCVEGPTDVEFIKHASKLWSEKDDLIPNLYEDTRVAFIPLGGSNLRHWVERRYLRNLNLPEVHIYDRDKDQKYKKECELINRRGDGSWCTLTKKLMIENYYHPDVIKMIFKVDITVEDDEDIVTKIKEEVKSIDPDGLHGLPKRKGEIKNWLAEKALPNMTLDHLIERDPYEEVRGWLRVIADKANSYIVVPK